MVSDVDVAGPTQGRRVGGPSASKYFLTVALWIPNSRSIARTLPLKERRLARGGGFGLAGWSSAAGDGPWIPLVLDP